MWLLVILTLLNAFANNKEFVLRYRIMIPGFPLNAFDILIMIGLVILPFYVRGRDPTEKHHPLLKWIFAFCGLAILAGGLGSMFNQVPFRATVTFLRNFASMPICVLLGYYLLPRPKSVTRFPYVLAAAGVIVAFMILAFFSRRTELFIGGPSVESLRTVDYISQYAGIAAALLLYSMISGVKLLPTWFAAGLGGWCLVGQFATLSRSDWLAALSGIGAAFFLLPPARRGSAIVKGLVATPVLLASLWAGLYFTSKATGTDFYSTMSKRVVSILPTARHSSTERKAWDTRLGSLLKELQLWSHSPLFGQGFGIQEKYELTVDKDVAAGFRHNSWTSTLAETGLIGLAAMVMVIIGTAVVGRRMVKDYLDRGSVLMGAAGGISGVYMFILGLGTGGFNHLRGAVVIGLICGVVLRARAMQQHAKESFEGYYDFDHADTDAPPPLEADGDGYSPYNPEPAYGYEVVN